MIGLVPAVADALLAAAAGAATLGLQLTTTLARPAWAAVTTPMPTLPEVVVAYLLLGLWWLRPRCAAPPRAGWWRAAIVTTTLLALGDAGYWLWERTANPTLRVTFLSIGQGDAAVVELPRGGALVIDGGGFAGDFDPGERLIAPFLLSRKILRLDALVLSHPQLDHYGGLAHLAARFAPREMWWSGARSSAASFVALERALAAAGTRARTLRRGMHWSLGPDVTVEIVHPSHLDAKRVNDGSVVLRLRFGATAILFTGDIERGAERELLASGVPLASDVLKVPHHGSATSSTRAWLAAVAPRVAVISSGADNRFGFPAPEVVRRLRAVGATTWNTAEDGAVRIVSDGRHIQVEPFTRAARPSRFVFPGSLW